MLSKNCLFGAAIIVKKDKSKYVYTSNRIVLIEQVYGVLAKTLLEML